MIRLALCFAVLLTLADCGIIHCERVGPIGPTVCEGH